MISVDRAKTILECYGGQPQAWPEQERYALQQALSGSKILQTFQQEALAVDEFMGFSTHKESSLDHQSLDQCVKRIFSNLPKQKQKAVKRPSSLVARLNKKYCEYTRPALLLASIMLAVIGLSSNIEHLSPKKAETLSISDYMAIYVDESYISSSNQLINDGDELEILAFLEPDILEDDR